MAIIKVLHVVSVETENYYLNNLVDFTDNNKISFSFITFGASGGFTREMEKRGCAVYSLNSLKAVKIPAALFKLWRLYKKINPEIVHTHLFIPSFWGLLIAKCQKRKTILTRHHSDALYVLPSKVKRYFWLRLEKYINSKSDHIIAPSRMVYDILVVKEKVSPKKVSLIPYGQTTKRFDAVTPALIQLTKEELDMQGRISLVCVSRLFFRKGHQYLFEALSTIIRKETNAILYLVGTGPYKEVLENIGKKLEISDKIRFLGWRTDALAIMAAADIIVHPSLEDALSSAVIEAIMLEKPVIATDISGARDTLNDGKYGSIVPPADAAAFGKALQETIAELPAAKVKAKAGRLYLLDYMSAAKVAAEYAKCYENLLKNSN
ncbi:MAG: glycosyltransferase family 4 protein [Chitinophagaceae bacterium]|nr:glycosyltransferase family 4 protein [Chitinophagaceae bacterium]